MKDFKQAEQIICAVIDNTELPVTVKFRSGWTDENIIAPEFAAMAEAAGAAAVTVHARTWKQMFGGFADRRVIARVKETVSIPVIGNGDILCHRDGLEMMAETGCDGVMVGRGALGNPWIFQSGIIPETLQARLPVILRHMELASLYLDTTRLLFRIKNQACRYFTGIPGAATVRKQITDCPDFKAITLLLGSLANQA
jgi:tRNA-dihydrouridine synthase